MHVYTQSPLRFTHTENCVFSVTLDVYFYKLILLSVQISQSNEGHHYSEVGYTSKCVCCVHITYLLSVTVCSIYDYPPS